jgi:hypothetical protein
VSLAALPLATAMLLFLLPRHEDLFPYMYSDSSTPSADDLLSPSQWDLVWESLTDNMPELSVLHQISTIEDSLNEQISDMTEDELKSLLDLLGGSGLG